MGQTILVLQQERANRKYKDKPLLGTRGICIEQVVTHSKGDKAVSSWRHRVPKLCSLKHTSMRTMYENVLTTRLQLHRTDIIISLTKPDKLIFEAHKQMCQQEKHGLCSAPCISWLERTHT